MKPFILFTLLLVGGLASSTPKQGAEPLPSSVSSDPRNLANGSIIPDEGYSDQPYVVITNEGHWLCVLTTGKGVEGEAGQHVVSTISKDRGQTWSPLVDIEPATGPEASWVMPLKIPSGRIYAFYTYNKGNVRELSRADGSRRRVDTLGAYMFKYSDDHGRSWSAQRYEIPMPVFPFDRENDYGGELLFFWGVGKPIVHDGLATFGFAKVGRWGVPGVLVRSQSHFMRSSNILTERDPAKIRWEVLPDGEIGLRAPKGPIAEEVNLVALSDGKLYCTYRTIDGYNCHAYSRDRGHTWSAPGYATYTPGGRRIKHPRAANFVRKFSNGKYLLWYHNNGGEAVHAGAWDYYRDRNPAWLAGGIEKSGSIHWSEPEIVLYDDDPKARISYPDFVEENGRYYITETQKTVARIHEIDASLLEGMWNQFSSRKMTQDGLATQLSAEQCRAGATFEMPVLPNLSLRKGFSLDLWVRLRELSPGQILLDARGPSGKGIHLATSDRFTLKLTLNDGQREASWDTDPGTGPGTLKVNAWQHVVFIVDGGPGIITCAVDGVLNDGGAVRQFGWGRFARELGDVNGSPTGKIAPKLYGEVRSLRLYNRYLRTSEAIANYRADSSAQGRP